MGNLHFVDDGNEGCKISDANKHLERACDMLGIDLEQTAMWLCYRKIQTMNEIMTKPLNAADVRFYLLMRTRNSSETSSHPIT